MKIIQFALTTMLCSNAMALSPTDVNTCDALYAKGDAESVLKSIDCYETAFAQCRTNDEFKLVYERAFIALSRVVNLFPKTDFEKRAIARGLDLVQSMNAKLPSTADVHYWSAVFTSFNAVMKDRGSVLPTHMFSALRSIQENLNTAISIDASIHLMGPKRVLGIMHTQMPGIAGGDKTLAQKMLNDAYVGAPTCSANHVEFARILAVNGKTDAAKTVLNQFLALSDAELNPYPNEPLRAPAAELLKDRTDAKNLLKALSEDE